MTGAGAGCRREWEAEAVEDGRLAGDDAASFRRHAVGCVDCRRELAALESLRRFGREVRPPASTDLHRRRQRAALVAVANRRLFVEGTARRPIARAAGVIALAAAALFAVLAVRAHRSHRVAIVAPPSAATQVPERVPRYDVTDVDHARWSVGSTGARTELRLTAGAARFHVEHLGVGERFLVLLPDGELEVRGTRFLVRIDGGRTTEVSVDEGLVALRLSGAAERMLAGGARWVPLAAVASSPTVVEVATTPAPPRPRIAAALVAPSVSTSVANSVSTAAVPVPDAQALFGDAMAAFTAGDYGRADAGFASFLARALVDGRREDAAFLRAVCHARRGDAPGAAALARSYLAAYPTGLRRSEARALADTPE